MGKFILRSKAVFTGLEDFPRPAAIAVVDKKIQAVLPWDFQRDKDYADWPLYDHGEKMIMSSFLDAHTHLFPEPLMAADMCVQIWEKDIPRQNV